jgi:hypothetical protein
MMFRNGQQDHGGDQNFQSNDFNLFVIYFFVTFCFELEILQVASIHSLCSVLLYLIQYYDIKFGIDLQSFSPGTLIFFTDKTDCHDIYIYIYIE